MKEKYALTKEGAEQEMEYFRRIFDVVRILHKNQIAGICHDKPELTAGCPCYSFWGRTQICENCTSAGAFETKTDKFKLEISKRGVYQVISRYLEVDGEPCVMELLREFDFENIIDLLGEKKLLSHLNDYHEKTYTDVLTGVYNRRFYEEKIKESVLSAGVAMIDIDDFKVYNDVYGHIAGDSVLALFASELNRSVRGSDKIIRYGGDEFLLIMPGVPQKNFESVLNHLLKNINGVVVPGFSEINLTSSIGATLCSGERVGEAVERADRLLYKAKTKKNSVATDVDPKTLDDSGKVNVLVVDDTEINRTILSSILSNEFNVIEADGGQACIDALERYGSRISLVLLDIVMPGVDGFGVLKYMTMNHLLEDIPVITITEDESEETMYKAYEMGVSDFINRPFDAKVVYKRVTNTVNLNQKQRRLVNSISGEILEKEKNNHILVDILAQVTEFRGGVGREHITNINRITELLLLQLMEKTSKYGLTKKDAYLISTASALHDIGKVEIDSRILNKPGRLTPEEFEVIKTHTVAGAEIIDKIHKYSNEPLVKYAHEICLYHHEKYDGKGYPCGLKGDDIPISAQVVSLADVYDALTAKRPYKEAFSSEKAIQMILNGECGQFNPLLVECLLEIKDLLKKDGNGEVE